MGGRWIRSDMMVCVEELEKHPGRPWEMTVRCLGPIELGMEFGSEEERTEACKFLVGMMYRYPRPVELPG